MVYGVSSNNKYLNSIKSPSNNTRKILMNEFFASSSVTMGGNGKTIEKENIKKLIDNPKQFSPNINDEQIDSFKKFYSRWDDLYGKDKKDININDFYKAEKIFENVINQEEVSSKEIIEYKNNSDDKKNKNLRYLSQRINGNEEEELTSEKLKEYLSRLIENNDEENNDDEIALVMNVLSDLENPTNEYTA